jgi:glycosyltransferase involved in cell wall biosynthesis
MKQSFLPKVFFMPGDGHGWALDEDLRQMRMALTGIVQETSLARAEIIHTPFWQGLSVVHPEILQKAFVIAHADNPPFFYLKQPDFLRGQKQVDLWVARSSEAFEQFHALRLPVTYIPYTIDEKLFFPIADKKSLRKKFEIPEKSYVITNLHRDSEGANLSTPKFQKAPELLLAILQELHSRGIPFHLLLAGPRRHWIRHALAKAGIPFTFVGKSDVEGDDFGVNILERSILNELMSAADLMLIPSRWEGGPQSIMEGAACRCKILSTPVGLAHDILEPLSLYHSISEAANRIAEDQKKNILQPTLEPQWERWQQSHTMQRMKKDLQELYQKLPNDTSFQKKSIASRHSWIQAQRMQIFHSIGNRICKKRLPSHVGWNHHVGKDHDLDQIFGSLGNILKDLNISMRPANGSGIEFIGFPTKDLLPIQKSCSRFQWITPSMSCASLLQEASIIAPGVQDIVNLRSAGLLNSVMVLPLPILSDQDLCEEPLVIYEKDTTASLTIWKAMAAGRPIIYPIASAYYEQVFHGGFSYQQEQEIPMLLEMARKEAPQLRALAKVPSRESAQKAIKQLLEIIAIENKFLYDKQY